MFKKIEGIYTAAKQAFKKNPNPGAAIKSVKTNVPDTKLKKLQAANKIATQRLKGAEAKLKQTKFEIENPNFAKGKFTFKKDKGKSESNREAYKRIQKENTKAKGGRVGLKFGSRKSNVQKIQETFGPKKKVPNKFKGFSKLPEKVQQKIDAKLAKKV